MADLVHRDGLEVASGGRRGRGRRENLAEVEPDEHGAVDGPGHHPDGGYEIPTHVDVGLTGHLREGQPGGPRPRVERVRDLIPGRAHRHRIENVPPSETPGDGPLAPHPEGRELVAGIERGNAVRDSA